MRRTRIAEMAASMLANPSFLARKLLCVLVFRSADFWRESQSILPEHSPRAFSHSIFSQSTEGETTHTETTHGQLSARWCARRPRTSCTRKHAQDRKHAGGEKSARASLSSLPLLSFCARAACARARRAEPCGPRFLAAELTPGRVCRARAGRRL